VPAWRCTSCGGAGDPAATSLDPRYSLGRCIERTRPCQGLRVLTADPDDLRRVLATNRLAKARHAHRKHTGPRGKLVPTCTYCLAMAASARRVV
jgi:hypothetical protein